MRKVVVLGGRFVILAAVDQVNHRDGVFLGGLVEDGHRRIAFQLIRQFVDQIAQRPSDVVDLLVLVGIHAGAAGKTDVLFALRGFQQRRWQEPAGAEQVDLEDQQVIHDVVEHVVEWRVGGDAAIPKMFAVDFDRRKAGRQRAGSHDMFRTDFLAQLLEGEIVEIGEVSRCHPDRADA
jgi:hypothetical protein